MNPALAVERAWHVTWPPVAQTGDGNVWVTGACWLYCRREGVRVLWVGSVRTPGATGDVYACGPCIAELDRIVRVTSQERAGTTGATTCEHRWLEKRNGKTFCGDCTRQLYL